MSADGVGDDPTGAGQSDADRVAGPIEVILARHRFSFSLHSSLATGFVSNGCTTRRIKQVIIEFFVAMPAQ